VLHDALRSKDEVASLFRRMLTTFHSMGYTTSGRQRRCVFWCCVPELIGRVQYRPRGHRPLHSLASWSDRAAVGHIGSDATVYDSA
jgi:hypothetical protein